MSRVNFDKQYYVCIVFVLCLYCVCITFNSVHGGSKIQDSESEFDSFYMSQCI